MIAEQHVFQKIRLVCLLVALVCAVVYFFLIVPDSFVGLPDFLIGLVLLASFYFTARYLLLPRLFRLSRFNMALFIMLFSVQVILIVGLFLAFSLFTGAMVITPGEWNIVNFWQVIVLFAPPNLFAFFMYIWERGLGEWRTDQQVKSRLKELELKEEQWQLLSLQKAIAPHFISNTLAAIRVLVRHDASKALDAVNRMICISNFYIAHQVQKVVSVQDELQQVENLVAIYALRHDKEIAYCTDIDIQVSQVVHIPTMFLINLVENALQYGVVDEWGNPIVLTLQVSSSGVVAIKVENQVSLLPLKGILSFGSTHERLRKQILFLDPDSGTFNVQQDGLSYQVSASFSLLV